jgi:hypothetical protein
LAGLPRTPRSIQRYCAKGHLEACRCDAPFGEIFLIKPESVDRHIAYINEVRPVATGRGLSRHAATNVAGENDDEQLSGEPAASDDTVRQAATRSDMSQPVAAKDEALRYYVERLEGENEFLRAQVQVKDRQIDALLERDKETNLLVHGLQRMLAPLLAAPERDVNRGAVDL